MFTGMIQWIGRFAGRKTLSANERLKIESVRQPCCDRSQGETIAQIGGHLTVFHLITQVFIADVCQEIRDLLTLGRVVLGAWVSLKWIMSSPSCFGESQVSDDVDCVGKLLFFHAGAPVRCWHFSSPSALMQKKKSAYVDAVSLSGNALDQEELDVVCNSHPLEQKGFLKEGSWVDWGVGFFRRDVLSLIQGQVA